MSEGDVSLIHDEDVLRRLWQQTEDFSRKKEIRAHMYRLREERLRNLYSPEPSAAGAKDLKDLSNAGWNVESEDRTTDDGHTHVKSVNANIEGRYDVEGGKGQFAAIDHHTQAVTEYHDENSSLKRNESSSKTAAHEHVVRKTDDGSHFSSTTSSSSTSKYQQVSTKNETVPYTEDCDQGTTNTNRNEHQTRDNYEQTLRSNDDNGELMSKKVEYPDENTKVIVETRRLPDGTRVTSTRREFRVPVQSKRSEHHSQSRTENKYSTSHNTNQTESYKTVRHTDSTIKDIVDSQRNVDNYDFKKHIIDDDFSETQSVRNYETNVTKKLIDSTNDDNYSTTSRHDTSRVSKKKIDNSNTDYDYSVNRYEKINREIIDRNESENVDFQTIRHETNKQVIDNSKCDEDYSKTVRYVTKINKVTDDNNDDRRPNKSPEGFDDIDRREITIIRDIKDTRNTEDKIHKNKKDTKEHIIDRKTTSDQYQTTYQTDYANKKISTDWSPSHQAWASTLRSDTPSTTRPSTRASSPGSRTHKSSTSSLRSSVSPDKTIRNPSSRGTSPSKIDRCSPSRTITDRYSSTHSTHTVTEIKSIKHTGSDGRPPTGRSPTRPGYSPERKLQDRKKPSVSPEKRPYDHNKTPSASPERKPLPKSSDTPNRSSEVPTVTRQNLDRKPGDQPTNVKPGDKIHPRTKSPQKLVSDREPSGHISDSSRHSPSPDRKYGFHTPIDRRSSPSTDVTRTTSPTRPYYPDDTQKRPSVSPDRRPEYKLSNVQSEKTTDKNLPKQSTSPDKQPNYMKPTENLKTPTKPDDSTNFKVSDTCRPQDRTRTSKVNEDHYRFISEETKMYENTDKVDTDKRGNKSVPEGLKSNEKSPSMIRKITTEVMSPDHEKIGHGKEPVVQSAHKFTVYDDEFNSTNVVTTTSKRHDINEDMTTHTIKPKDVLNLEHDKELSSNKYGTYDAKSKDSPKPQSHREPSPTKYTTSDMKHPQDEVKNQTPKDKDSLKPKLHREPSPTKYGTYDKKHPHDEVKNQTPDNKDTTKSQPHREPSPAKNDTYTKKQPHHEIKNQAPKDKDSPRPQSHREPSPDKYETYNKKYPQYEIKNQTPKDKDSPKPQLHREPSPTKYVTSKDQTLKDKDSHRPQLHREPSPTKFGTYDKKYLQDELNNQTPKDKDATQTQPSREPSPTKDGTYDKNLPHAEVKDQTLKGNDSQRPQLHRESSPTKFGTYDKKYPQNEIKNQTPKNKDATQTQPSREPSPTKDGTYDKKHPHDKVKDQTLKDKDSHRPQLHRESSPTKFGTYDKKYPQDEIKNQTPKDKDATQTQPSREPSPTKDGTYDKKRPQDKIKNNTPKDTNSDKSHPDREPSSTKNDTYNRKHPHDEFKDRISPDKSSPKRASAPHREVSPTKYSTNLPSIKDKSHRDAPKIPDEQTDVCEEDTIIIRNERKDTKYDSLTRREKNTKVTSSPSKKVPRDSTSPVKSPTKDNKYKHTTEFLETERSINESNKNTLAKGHPRQLFTPSSSPTRKAKPETEPSTGQSSPTTSVSGFVYYGSPPRDKTELTDLDDQKYCTEFTTTKIYKTHERPDTLDMHRTPSPSKIPCRSPSPEKVAVSPKNSLPRKSSLKKPSEPYQSSPAEKPPTNFCVSPSDEQDHTHPKVVRKVELEPKGDDASKPKPLLERRETYEDRCKKILGMIDIKENITKETIHTHEKHTNLRSPSMSPRENSVPRDNSSPFRDRVMKDNTKEVTDFISHEKESIVNVTHQDNITYDAKPKTPRDSSPTKLQDIITVTKSVDDYNITKKLKESMERESSPERLENKPSDKYIHPDNNYEKTYEVLKSKITSDTRSDFITDKHPKHDFPVSDSNSPDMRHVSKQVSPTKIDINTPTDEDCREPFSSRPSHSPEQKPGYTKTTTVTSKYTTSSIEDIGEAIITTEEKKYVSMEPVESPTRKSKDKELRSISPTKHVPKEDTSKRGISPTKEAPSNILPKKKQGASPDKSEIIPGYMRTTASVIATYDTNEKYNIQEKTQSTEEEIVSRKSSKTPNRKTQDNEEPVSNILSKQKRHPEDQSPERKFKHEKPTSSPKDIVSKSPEPKTLRELSPTKSDKIPEYPKTKDKFITKKGTSTTVDIIEINTFKTVNEIYPERSSESPTCINPDQNYGRPKTTDKRPSLSPTDDFPLKTPTNRHFEESSPTSPSKTPGYMKTTTAVSAKHDTVSATEDFGKTTILKATEKQHSSSRTTKSPPRQVDHTEYTSYSKDNISVRDSLSPERKPEYPRLSTTTQDSATKGPGVRTLDNASSPTRFDETSGYMKTTTTYSTKYNTMDHTGKILSSQTLDEKRPRSSVSPIQSKDDQNKPTPECLRTTSPSRPRYSKDSSTTLRHSLSPERKTKHQRPTTHQEDHTQVSEDEFPDTSSPSKKIPSYMKTTTSFTTKHGTNISSEDVDETIISKIRHEKQPNENDSHPRYVNEHSKMTPEYPRTTSPSKSRYPEDSTNKPEKIPGYMMTTTTFTAKNDTVEETHNSKSTEKKPRLSESPTKPNEEFTEPDHNRTMSSTRPFSNFDEKCPERDSLSPERKPGYTDMPTRNNDNSYTKETSPIRKDTTKIVTNTVSKHDTTSTKEETISSKTTNKKQHTSQSLTRKSKENPKSSSHYPTEDLPYTTRQPELKSPTRTSASPEKNIVLKQFTAPHDESSKKKPGDNHPHNTFPSTTDNTPGYMKTTTSITSKYDTSIETDNIIETGKTTSTLHAIDKSKATMEQPRSTSPSKTKHSKKPETPELGEPEDDLPVTYDRISDKIKSTYTKTKHTDVEDNVKLKTTEKKQPWKLASSPTSKISKDTFSKPVSGQTRTVSPTKLNPKTGSSVNKPGLQQPFGTRDIPVKKPAMGDKHAKISSPSKPEEIKLYMQPTSSVISPHDIEELVIPETVEKHLPLKPSTSPTSCAREEPIKPELFNKPEEPRQLRTPSPIKKLTRMTDNSIDFIVSEREQEVLHKVQKSLRKLSPERKDRSPSPEKSPTKTTTTLHEQDIKKTIEDRELITNEITKTTDEVVTIHTTHSKPKDQKLKEPKVTGKPRTVSPTKKPVSHSPTKVDKSPESPTKSRSISPRKPIGERPQSPQVSKIASTKPKEQTPIYMTRKPTPVTITTTKIEKAITMDVKKAIGNAKQNITKTTVKATASKFMSPTTKNEPEPKRVPTPKGIKEYPQKDTDTKISRTTSDTTLKSKKTSPQRMKSKPEIQVNDLSTSKTPKSPKSAKESQPKFPSKPKSATSLNMSTDEDDIIIDVQQSKSSRENSPDRICPTPVNFSDDVGTPRFPDQVSEPDDDLRRRTHNTIHETESLVDDIVEICEDDELFVKRTNVKEISEYDESLLSVQDKVSKYTNKIETVTKPKDTTATFKDTEIKSHSDFLDQDLKSDECLLSVSEKVDKFAKGPRDTRDSKSPSRRIVDEYDKHTIYQDDYTKLSVNDKAHLFVETAENIKTTKTKPAQRVERPDLSNVDESLKSDDCLLSVSDKVNKFVKTAEQFLTETHEVDEKDKKIKEQHDKIMRQIVEDYDDETTESTEYIDEAVTENIVQDGKDSPDHCEEHPRLRTKPDRQTPSRPKDKEFNTPNLKPTDRAQTVKITTIRSSEAVKKAKALFENIASTTTKKTEKTRKPTAKLTDIGVKKITTSEKPTFSTPTVEDSTSNVPDLHTEVDYMSHDYKEPATIETTKRVHDIRHQTSPSRLVSQSPERSRSKSPLRHMVETTTTKTVVIKHSNEPESDIPPHRPEIDKSDKVPGYLRPTKTSQIKEEKIVGDTEVSSRRGSGKFGVELRRTSVDRATPTGERRRSIEHPCIEDIFDLDLLEQMLEKVTGYEQRRRIRAQIRVARKGDESITFTKTTKTTLNVPKSKSSDSPKSPERSPKSPQKTLSPDPKSTTNKAPSQPREVIFTNGHNKETIEKTCTQRHESPEKIAPKSTPKSSTHQLHVEKKTRPQSPTKTTIKPKSNRFNEYASAYMKKVGLNETTKPKTVDTKKSDVRKTTKQVEEHKIVKQHSSSKSFTEKTSSRDVIETEELYGKRSPSPEKKQSPVRKTSPLRQERSPSPEVQRRKSDTTHTETTIKAVYDVDKKIQPKVILEEKPSWITNRNLKKITSETRTISSKKMEPEKPKYRATSPSKVISKPLDAITSSYGPGPLDSDGKPLFGIKALRNTSSNYQVKGTVIRQEFHSRNGGEPEGTVSVTAYSTEPEELEKLLESQGAPPSRIHGLAAITTTRKFGGDTGTTIHQAHGKEERAVLEQFTHSDRRVSDFDLEVQDDSFEKISETRRTTVEELDAPEDMGETVYREETTRGSRNDGNLHEVKERVEIVGDKKTVRKSSVKSLTEKYIKSANETTKTDRTSYPKAGLILRTATMKDSVSSDSSAHAGLVRTDSEHSLGSLDDTTVTTTSERIGDGVRTTTTTTTTRHHDRSFLDDSSKVTGVQDILTRMKNADIVIQEGDNSEEAEARALLNKFLGASVLMAGMQGYVTEKPSGKVVVKQETVRSSGGKVTSSRTIEEIDLDQCWDERVLKKLLEECTDYEQRRRLRARIRTLMAEQEACASAVTEALAAAGEPENSESGETREEAEVTVTSSVRRDSSEKIISSSSTTKTSKVTESVTRPAPKPVSPFTKFRQLEKQNSTTSPKM